MNDLERYDFDRLGYLVIPGLLSKDEARMLHETCLELEADALACEATSPRFKAVWGPEYWQSEKYGYFAHGQKREGATLMVEDFFNYSPKFDFLVGHPRTMEYIRRMIRGKTAINNSELRIRYPGNFTGMHMGFPHGHGAKYRYNVLDGHMDCMMVRMVYFLHNVGEDEGVFCAVPGTHKSAFPPPVNVPVEAEPGVVGLSVEEGDAILFTEATRHGGFVNRSRQTRYTLHIGYGPHFLKSQNISTMDEEPNVTDALRERLTQEQRELLVCAKHEPVKKSN